MSTVFGEYLRQARSRQRLTLRQFCQRTGLDPGNVSRIERGLMTAPESEEVLLRFATGLGVRKATNEWQELLDRAAASRGELPRDLAADKGVVSALPLLFRTLRGQKLTPELLDVVSKKVQDSRSK